MQQPELDDPLRHPHHQRLPDAHAAEVTCRVDPRHRWRRHAVRLRPRHAEPLRLRERRLRVPVATTDQVGSHTARPRSRSLAGRYVAPTRRVDPDLLWRPPALHLQPRRHSRHGHGPGDRPGRRAVVRDQREGPADSRHRSRSPARIRTETPPADAAAGRGPSLRERPIRSPRCRRRVTIASTRDAVMLQCQITFPIGIVEIRLEQAHGMAATRPAGELEPGASRGVIRSESKHSPGRVITLVGVVSKLRTAERISRASNGFTLPYVSPKFDPLSQAASPTSGIGGAGSRTGPAGQAGDPARGPGRSRRPATQTLQRKARWRTPACHRVLEAREPLPAGAIRGESQQCHPGDISSVTRTTDVRPNKAHPGLGLVGARLSKGASHEKDSHHFRIAALPSGWGS